MEDKTFPVDELVIYRNLRYGELFKEMAALMGMLTGPVVAAAQSNATEA